MLHKAGATYFVWFVLVVLMLMFDNSSFLHQLMWHLFVRIKQSWCVVSPARLGSTCFRNEVALGAETSLPCGPSCRMGKKSAHGKHVRTNSCDMQSMCSFWHDSFVCTRSGKYDRNYIWITFVLLLTQIVFVLNDQVTPDHGKHARSKSKGNHVLHGKPTTEKARTCS